VYFWRGFQDTPLPLEVKKISAKVEKNGAEMKDAERWRAGAATASEPLFSFGCCRNPYNLAVPVLPCQRSSESERIWTAK